MEIGIYGGSFDPVHTGHLRLAEYTLRHAMLDEIWLLVSPLNPLKPQGYAASDKDRLEMARLATADMDKIKASDFEFHLPRPSYSYNTLCRLREEYPGHQFKLIIGGDNWASFGKWKNPDEIIGEFGVIVYPRPGEKIPVPPGNVHILKGAPLMEVSSTEIRKAIRERGYTDISFLERSLDPKVLDYISTHQLYGRNI